MKKTGYVISLVGGILAIILSVLIPITGSYFYLGDDIARFYTRNQDKLDNMWADVGEYNGTGLLLKVDLDDYIDDYSDVLEDLKSDDLKDIGDENGEEAFDEAARIMRDVEDYLPDLRLGVIACVIASVIALIGSEIARSYRIAGGVMVLSGAALTLIFSLVASSIISMAPASLLLIVGGALQIAGPKTQAASQQQETALGGGVQQ